MRTLAAISIVALAAACGGGAAGGIDAPTGSGDGPAAIDGAGGDAAQPIVAPDETWTWVPLAGMACGDGTATGVGVNLTTRSDRLMIYFQGGGACWDASTCFVVKSAVHIEGGYGEADFQAEIAQVGASYLFQRTAANPFADASWIYVPYCTGDLHDGDRVATYDVNGTAKRVHHVGGANADVVLTRAAATRPATDAVWLVGVSAGGYAVALDWEAARAAFPGAAVHALADSAPLVTMEPTRWAAMQASWAMRLPAGCTGCAGDLGALPAYLRGSAPAGDRYGLLANTHDSTISTYFGLTADQLATEITAEQAGMTAGSGQAAYLLDGTGHVLLANPAAQTSGGVVLSDWIAEWATGDGAWASVGP
jgi:Pectinacetylesterase